MDAARGVIAYDIGTNLGFSAYSPKLKRPYTGVIRLPSARTDGSMGPTWDLIWEHVAWADRNFGGLGAIGYENFLVPTGGRKDDATSFTTSPKTIKTMVGSVATIEHAAQVLGFEATPIHNQSWRRYWLGKRKFGVKREMWKALSIVKAQSVGVMTDNDDESDSLGQLHWLLNKLEIIPPWDFEAGNDLVEQLKQAEKWLKDNTKAGK